MSMSLRFRGSDPWYRESPDGLWRVVKVGVNGSQRFEVWRKQQDGWRQVKVNLLSFEAAKEHAEGIT